MDLHRSRMKPSELRNAFTTAKARAARQPAPPRLLDFVNADDHTARVSSSVPLHKPLFEPTPAEVWIDEYTPFQTLTTKLSFRNCDSVARRFKIEPPASPLFKVVAYSTAKAKDRIDGKIAAGMDVAFLLEFNPQEIADVAFDLVCCTERERFALPVRVRGRVAALDIPDEVDFGVCPVRMQTSKVLTVHNVGSRSVKYAFRTSEHFSISPEHAALAQGAAVQLELRITPPRLSTREGELLILDDAGHTAVVTLQATVKNLDVYVSVPLVEPSATYISLSSRKTIKICNDSEYPLDFVWKAFPDVFHEQQERDRLLEELDAMEALELEQLALEQEGESADDRASAVVSPFDGRKAVEIKYKHLRKAAVEDAMQFVDDCFALTPITGRVWANSEVDVVTSFSPVMARLYNCSAFLEIGGQESRLPLQIRGQGIGPKAKVVYNELLDFGDVYISDERTRDFTIQNKGEIPAVYELIPLNPPLPEGMSLRVVPSAGTLAVNEMCKVEVSFSSHLLGEVFQPVRFRLQGSEEQLSVRVKANVVPPVFHFDVDQVDFGAVSYSFPQTRTMKLINTSKIAMDYSLRIPEEANYKKKEFELSPVSGRLAAYGQEEICLSFLPMNVKLYDYRLAVQVAGITSDLVRLPIRAQSFVPDISVQRAELSFGACFLRYPHKQTLILENKSPHLHARFDISEQDDHSRAIASYNPNECSGVLRPDEKVALDIYLSCEKLGPIRLPMSIAIPGSTDLPLAVTLTATGTGPRVELDQAEVNWGSCTCLVDHERVLTMTNASLIPAPYKTFIRNARSKFQIDQKEGTVAPGEAVQFKLTANLDDTILFKDTLHILIAEGENLVVPLAIKGTGTTMWSPSELRVIDFGHQMTSHECEWSCTLENKGKRSQVLTWSNRTVMRAKLQLAEANAVANKKATNTAARPAMKAGAGIKNGSGDAVPVDDITPVFSVFPATIELKPRTACVFLFKGISMKAGMIAEELVCETRVGKEKNNKVAFVTEIRGDFLNPRLEPSISSVQFVYVHTPGVETIPRQSQQLSLTNVCALPLSFTLRTQPPFSLDCWEAELQPGEKVDFTVEFYPGFKDDHLSRIIQGKVAISYIGHPQKDNLEVVGDISFPNLQFEMTKIDFGCTLNDTQRSMLVTVTNISKVDTTYRWVFIEDEQEARALATPKKPYIPVNQVFDILPIRGSLKPGDSEKVEFLFYGHANRKFKSMVSCEVEGGPEYELTLTGEASSLVYKLDKQCLDFGQVLYNKTEDREFAILNVGKVPFSYSITMENITRGRVVLVSPMTNKIAPNDKQRVLVQLKPGIPEPFEETILIEVAHFQPVEFKLFGSGTFAAVSINLPRENHPASTILGEHPKWRELKKQAKLQLESTMLSASAIAADQAAAGMMVGSDSKSSISTGPGARTLERGSSFASAIAGGSGAKSVVAGSPSKAATNSSSTLRTSATAAFAAAIDDLDVEIEASRMFFAGYLVVQDRKKQQQPLKAEHELDGELRDNNNTREDAGAANVETKPHANKSKPSAGATTSTEKTEKLKSPPESFPFVLSQFVLDFGNVVIGTHKVKKFSVINIGHTPASFQLDKNLAQSRGFQIEPERVVRLPEKQPIEFTVTFQARKNVSLGVHQVQLPIAMKNGPPCLVTIRAVVTVPDIAISMEALDFGKMAVGTCHTAYTQLQNVSSVQVEWAIKKPMGSPKDLPNFRITPQSGVLAPGNKVNVQVEFLPDEGRLYALKLPIKVAANAKTRSITLRGEGSELRVSFAPAVIDLGPILPCSEPTECVVELRNESEYPVEVFSLDFDQTYKSDEELLRGLSVFGSDDILQLPLRLPGQTLEEYLTRHGIQIPASAADTLESLEDAPAEELLGENPDGSELAASDSTGSVGLASRRQSVQSVKPFVRTAIDYIVMGPPHCGKSTQAKLLGEREGLNVWTIDDAIQRVAMDMDSELGRTTRLALGLEDPPALATGESTAPETDSNQISGEIETADQVTKPLGVPTVESLLDQILRWRLAQPDLENGSVLDGWENAFVSLESTLSACSKAMPTSRIIWLQLDEDAYEAMTAAIMKTQLTASAPPRKSSNLSLSPSRSRLTASRSSGILESDEREKTEERQSEDGGDDVGMEPQAQDEELANQDGSNSTGQVDGAVEGTDTPLSPEEEAMAAILAKLRSLLQAPPSASRTFAEYLKDLAQLRRRLALFIARDRQSMQGMTEAGDLVGTTSADVLPPPLQLNDDATESTAAGRNTQTSSTSTSNSPAGILKAVSRADNFVLEVPVVEPAAALTIHSSLVSTLEKYVRELELSHLVLPPPAKFQVLKRPHQRFSRKPIQRFTLHPLPSTDDSSAFVTGEGRLETPVIEAGVVAEEAQTQDAVDVVETRPKSTTRWVLEPFQSTKIAVRFASTDVGVFDCTLGFEVVGVRREFNLFCRGTASVPQINTDPRNVFMSRVKSRAENVFVHKKFVLSKNQFEFGPLIVPATPAKAPDSEEAFTQLLKAGTSANNIESFRISNVSKYALRVDFSLSEVASTAFAFAPAFVELAENETKELKVWASPPQDGLHENALVCCVSDNPEPVLFPVSCFGCTPSIDLRGPWEQPAGDSSSSEQSATNDSAVATDALAVGSTPSSTPRSSAPVSARPASAAAPPQHDGPVLDFEKLLLKRQDEKTFFLENTCAVAVAWRVAGVGEIPPDFRVFPVDGVIKPFQKAPVLVVFTANTEALHKHALRIEFSDADSALRIDERRRALSLMLQAEAYKIDVCSFESDSNSAPGAGGARDGSLDFGLVRVGESPTRSFSIKNRGKYNIKFVLSLRSSAAREYFKVDPAEMVLEPDKSASVQVTFQTKAHEVTLRDNKDIKCTIIEMLSGEACAEFHVLTSVRAVFSVFRLQPNRGINFGPLKFNDKPKTKRIEIRNDGDFVFKFRVSSLSASVNTMPASLMLETQLTPSALTVSQFQVTPDCGSVDPGTTAALDVVFQPKDCSVYRELLYIDISGRNPLLADDSALRYELIGESCFPGISASDYESIFEEQIVVRTIGSNDASVSSTNKVASTTTNSASALMAMQTVLFAEKEKVFSFGAMVAAASAKGSVERFKISNPTKVTTTVQFQISSTAASAEHTAAMTAAAAAFSVQPSMWEIPPLEHRFVNIHFKPTAILSYSAVFTAQVDDSPAQASTETLLQFQLRGEGTMPCVAISDPTQREASTGALLMPFGRVRVSKAKELALVLRNDGILSSTVLFSMQANPNFVFAHGNGSVVVAARTTETLSIQFKPQKAHDEPLLSVLKITVQNNPFEETNLKLSGQGYREDLVFEDLPHGHDDELHFDDIVLSQKRSRASDCDSEERSTASDVKVFTLCNQSNDVVRFAWPTGAAPFSFAPSVGHLRPRGYKLIKATFSPPIDDNKAVVMLGHKLQVQSQRITLKDEGTGSVGEWDDTMHTVSFDDSTGQQEAVAGVVAEPAFDAVGPATAITLSCFAAADAVGYECDAHTIAFKRTFMLQVCSHKITVKNTSKIRLAYSWRWVRMVPSDHGIVDFVPANIGTEDDDDEDCPFEISPSSGVIPAEASQSFVVRFAPMEVDDFHYELRFIVPDDNSEHDGVLYGEDAVAEEAASSAQKPLYLSVSGSSLRPACHFDIERSDYISRRTTEMPGPNGELGPLDPSVKVIEMESLGVRVKNTRRFYVVNPTNVSYEFVWVPEGDANASFRCATPKGLMLAGKRCEMIFEFTPQQLDLQEMFWRFCVPHFQVNQLFLLVGTTTEPRVTLDRGSVNFNTLLIGTKTSQSVSLVNHEHIPFNFVFDKTAIDFAGEAPALLVHPLSGVVPPNGRALIDLEFIPLEEKSYNFNLNCIVKRKPTRLSLNVKGEGYSIHDALTITGEDPLSDSRQAVVGSGNLVDFGAVRVHESAVRSVVIHNTGKFNFEFNWSHSTSSHIQPKTAMSGSSPLLIPALSIEPLQGTVKKNDKVVCTLAFAPVKPMSLDGLGQLTCTVAGARHYQFNLHGSAVPPSLQFSFTSHDFGPCFIADADALPQSEQITLTIFNMDTDSSVDLDCLFEKKTHLRVECPPTVLGPRETLSIPIVFTARQEISYLELVPFVINGSSTVSVSFRGEGVVPKVELTNTSMQTVTFGALQIGQQLTRSVKIVNRAKRKAVVEFIGVHEGSDGLSDGENPLESLGISVFPHHELSLKAKETADIEFRFSPTQRIVAFQRSVFIRVAGSRRKLLTLTGCCQGMDVQLETDTISFGTVCLGSQLVRKVHLQNRGDVAAKFQWNARAFAPDFTISPTEGVVAPNNHKALEVTFKPIAENADIRYERLAGAIDGTDPVFLTLVGSCVKQATSSIQDVFFESPVREETSKSVTIENKTLSPWNLLPVVQGEHWSCPENVAVPAEGKASLAIVYRPLTMTKQADDGMLGVLPRPDQHQGSIFLAIPDGSALLYNVYGKASTPAPAGSLSVTTPAKKSLPISIPITNWLKQMQTFRVEIQKPESASTSVLAQGALTLTLQSGTTRNYHLKFFSYTEGVVPLTVRFVNPDNGEYLQYEVEVTVSRAAEVETIRLEAPVRQSIKKTITIENPFTRNQAVQFMDKENWWKCSSPSVRVRQLSDINGRPEGVYEVEYRPTIHSDTVTEAMLTIAFVELGEYTYKLMLATQGPGTERVLQFKAALGGSQIQTFSFTSYSDRATEIGCSVVQPAFFSIPPSVKIEPTTDWEGKTHSVQIKFEPEALGEVRDTLVLRSDIVGDYRCSLEGVAVPPLPQGPFVFSGSKDIEFKNVFSSARDFDFVVDNPKFVVATKNMSIPAKTAKVVSIRVDPNAGPATGVSGGKSTGGASTITGKLLISCPSMKELPPWVYYLEATP